MSQLLRFRFLRQGSPGRRRAPFFLPVLVLLLVSQGCSDDSTGGVLADPCLDYSPSGAAAAGTVTTRLADGSDCLQARVEIVATGVVDVWSLETTVTFDPSVVSWVGHSKADSILGSDGTAVAAIISETASGELTVGVTRTAADEGIDIGAEGGVLVELIFALYSSSTADGLLTLGEECLTTFGDPPQADPAVTCSGGTFTVR